jgi:hypothetical protein
MTNQTECSCGKKFHPAPAALNTESCPECIADGVAHGGVFGAGRECAAQVRAYAGLKRLTPEMARLIRAYAPVRR